MRKIILAAAAFAAATPALAQVSGAGGLIAVNIPVQNIAILNDFLNASQISALNNLNVPITVQAPISVAANVCGVSVSALSASIASGQAGCTATTTSPQLTQAVQQQVAAGGSVTGGPQTQGPVTNNMM